MSLTSITTPPSVVAGAPGTSDVADRLAGEIPGLLRYARTLVRDPGQAEDLVQDTVVRALERAGSFRGESSLRTWLHRILHNLAVDGGRRRSVDPVDVSEDAVGRVELLWQDDGYTVDAALAIERAELRETLQDALLRVPLIYRSTVVLHDVEGLTMTEVAEIQRIGLPAAKQRLRRGRMMLVSELSPEHHRVASVRRAHAVLGRPGQGLGLPGRRALRARTAPARAAPRRVPYLPTAVRRPRRRPRRPRRPTGPGRRRTRPHPGAGPRRRADDVASNPRAPT